MTNQPRQDDKRGCLGLEVLLLGIVSLLVVMILILVSPQDAGETYYVSQLETVTAVSAIQMPQQQATYAPVTRVPVPTPLPNKKATQQAANRICEDMRGLGDVDKYHGGSMAACVAWYVSCDVDNAKLKNVWEDGELKAQYYLCTGDTDD